MPRSEGHSATMLAITEVCQSILLETQFFLFAVERSPLSLHGNKGHHDGSKHASMPSPSRVKSSQVYFTNMQNESRHT